MSLTEEWFRHAGHRNSQRDANGVSMSDVTSALCMWHSSVQPVAVEMAEWLYMNWPLEKFFQLSKTDRDLLQEIIETVILPCKRNHTEVT